MGGIRIYVFEDDGQVRRLPLTVFDRIDLRKLNIPLLRYAGQRVRYAMVFLQLVDRKSTGKYHADYSILSFDQYGFVDGKEEEESMHLTMAMMPSIEEPNDILDELAPSLAHIKYWDKFKWTPTKDEIRIIEGLIREEMC